MDFFRSIITQILEDMTRAQHQSNLLSAKLAPQYMYPEEHDKPPALGFFPVPNSAISTVGFTLRFGIEEIASLLAVEIPKALQDATQAIVELIRIKAAEDTTLLPFTDRELAILEQAIGRFLLVEWMQSDTSEVGEELVNEICNKLQSLLESIPEANVELSQEEIADTVSLHLTNAFSIEPTQTRKQLAAMLKSSQLELLNSENLCSITVNCEMRNFELAFHEDDPPPRLARSS